MAFLPRHLRRILLRSLALPLPLPATHKFGAVIFKVDRIGDFALSLSAIRLLLDHFGHNNSCLILNPLVAPLAKDQFPGVPIVALPLYSGKIVHALAFTMLRRWKLSATACEHLVSLRHQRNEYHDLALAHIRARQSYGLVSGIDASEPWLDELRNKTTAFSFTNPIPADGAPPLSPRPGMLLCRELGRHRQLVSQVTGKDIPPERILPRFVNVDVEDGDVLLLAPFGQNPIRNYPDKLMPELLSGLCRVWPGRICLTGAPDQEARLEDIRRQGARAGMKRIEMRCRQSLSEFVQLVARSGAILTAESAAAHIATALNKPTVVFIGGGHYGHFGPWQMSSRQIWISNRMACFGCNWKCIHTEPRCITSIGVDQLCEALAKVLKERESC